MPLPKFTGAVAKYPARSAVVAYLVIILVGTLILLLPACHGDPSQPLSKLDAVFTATSAVCVTGLIVRSTPHDLSLLGQCVVLLLIQIGGIGILTFTTLAALRWGLGVGLRQKLAVSQAFGSRPGDDLRRVIRSVLWTVACFEGGGFMLLFVHHMTHMPVVQAAWHALFHSVSAFCNAGFALHDDNLVAYQGNLIVNLTVCALIIIGGIGFPVLLDLKKVWWNPRFHRWYDLSLHTKLVLWGTSGLLLIGTLAFLVLERNNTLADLSTGRRLLVAFFHSTTCRTAGFNTVDVGALTNAMLFVSILLMVIGASPCSTGGGFKVSTMMVLVLVSWAKFRGHLHTRYSRRTIGEETIDRSIAAVLLFALIGVVGLTLLLAVEQSEFSHRDSAGLFLETLFEVISALGTVGLSMGITAELSDAAQVLLIVMMFVGRLGPLSVFAALSRIERSSPIQYPKEDVLVG